MNCQFTQNCCLLGSDLRSLTYISSNFPPLLFCVCWANSYSIYFRAWNVSLLRQDDFTPPAGKPMETQRKTWKCHLVSRCVNCYVWMQIYWLREQPGERSRYSVWLRAGRPRGRSSSPGMSKNFHFSTSGVHQTSYPMGTGGSCPGGKAVRAWG
jgi:hypothetical protein